MIGKVALLLITLFAMTTFGYWRYTVAGQPHQVAQVVIIQDPSDSIKDDCGRIAGLAERSLNLPETGQGSTITLFALGNPATADEPQMLGQFKVPFNRRAIEGQQHAMREKQQLLADLRSRCGEVKQTTVSPIFQAIKRGVEHLKVIGSADDARYLFIQTDGEETDNLQIKRALDSELNTNPKLPSPIQNQGVKITFCGIAETVGSTVGTDSRIRQMSKKRDSQRVDRLGEVWSKLFTNPERVSFEPYCSRERTESN